MDTSSPQDPLSPFHFCLTTPAANLEDAQLFPQLDGCWQVFQRISLEPLFRTKLENPFTSAELMRTVSLREGSLAFRNICTYWTTLDDPPFRVPRFFYDKLSSYVKLKCRQVLVALVRERDFEFLEKTLSAAKKFSLIATFVENYFSHLTRVAVLYPTSNMMALGCMLKNCFISEIYNRITIRLRKLAFTALKKHRYGIISGTADVERFTILIETIDSSAEFTEAEWDHPLRQNCIDELTRKEPFLKRRCLCVFIKDAHARMEEVGGYSIGLRARFNFRNLIHQKTEEFFFANEGKPLIHLVEDEALEALSLMCETYGCDQEFMKKVANTIERHIAETVIVKFKESVGEGPEPYVYFTGLLRAWAKHFLISKKSFSNGGYEQYIIEALTKPFDDIIIENVQLIREQLQNYFDMILTKSGERKRVLKYTAAYEEIDATVRLFATLPDVAETLDMYLNKLMKRILREADPSDNVWFFHRSLMENFSGVQSVTRLKALLGMVTHYEENTINFLPRLSLCEKSRIPNVIPFQGVKAIHKVDWPNGPSSIAMKLPKPMEQITNLYNCFFRHRYDNKKFEYNFACDRVVISTKLFSPPLRETELHLTTQQLCVLDVFQDTDGLSVRVILENIKHSNESDNQGYERALEEQCFKILGSMMTKKYPLLTKVPDSSAFGMGDLLFLNKLLVLPRRKVILPVP